MYSRMEQLATYMNIYKSWLLCSWNDSLRHVTVYNTTLRHQSAWTKARSKKETTKSERRGNNNKTDVHGDLSLTSEREREREREQEQERERGRKKERDKDRERVRACERENETGSESDREREKERRRACVRAKETKRECERE